jgi:tricarballylate dehydrogenase
LSEPTTVIVAGAGNAALCAAIAASNAGAQVRVLERASEEERGGNSRFTAGAMRFVYDSSDEIRALVPDMSDEEASRSDFGTYTRDQFFDDMARLTQYRCDPGLTETLIDESYPTLRWMQEQGVRFLPMYARQAFKIEDRFRFWGGLTLEAWGGGPGLIESLFSIAKSKGVNIDYGCRALGLEKENGGITGVRIRKNGREETRHADAVILACGGFEANREWRTRYLGPGWELAKVRGTRFNTGDGIRMALDAGAAPEGNWSGCHAVGWDRNAPEYGDLNVGDGFQKHSYPFGLLINADGKRFVDEGADFRNYTYAKYGREILNQPEQFAWQVFDNKVTDLLRDEYRIREVTRVTAESIEELAGKLEGVDPACFLNTVAEYNASIDRSVPFNPTIKDGRSTSGLEVNKSNWASAIDEPPFVAYQTTCGITFTFGGIKINDRAQVIDDDGEVIPGLYAAGELVGGLFYFNYPGGTGLTSGSVFGRIAGEHAARQELSPV